MAVTLKRKDQNNSNIPISFLLKSSVEGPEFAVRKKSSVRFVGPVNCTVPLSYICIRIYFLSNITNSHYHSTALQNIIPLRKAFTAMIDFSPILYTTVWQMFWSIQKLPHEPQGLFYPSPPGPSQALPPLTYLPVFYSSHSGHSAP